MSKTIYQQVIEQGIEHDSHQSDLYIPVNGITYDLVTDYEHSCNVTKFISQKDGQPWYEIPFAYDPWWQEAEKTAAGWTKAAK